jgi:aspartyl-tRNA(Asn)/glutamyl-tRNA(Gln) amidotransferase subunit A
MPDIGDDIFFASITELNQKLRAKEFTAVELTRAFCDRLERLGGRYNALALSLRERAIRQARDVDGDIGRERFRGPLQGIPYAVKDLLTVAGEITTWGAKPFAAQVFDYTATAVTKIAKAGGVLTGKLAMVELAGGGGYRFANASMFGSGINPWDRSRWSGGSSSGPGSAVAAGLVTYALGSETSGSILTPSAYCGVTGLRPTYGLVSRYGAMPLSWTMDKIGPMCRTAEDCGIVLQAIAGKDDNDPGTAGKSFYFVPKYHRDMKTIRVGYSPVDFDEWAAAATRPVFKQALDVFRGMGVTFVEAKLPALPYGDVTRTIITAEGASVFEDLIVSGGVDQLADKKQIAGLRSGLEIASRDYLKAMRIRRLMQQEFRKLMTNIDVLIAPARLNVASKLGEPLDAPPSTPVPDNREPGFTSLIPAGNLIGFPALSLPCGFAEGLPVALQLVSRPFTENLILAMGIAFQRTTNFHRERPRI